MRSRIPPRMDGRRARTLETLMSILINAYCTHRNPPVLRFPHVLNERRSRNDNGMLDHLEDFIDYVLGRGDQQMTRVKYHLMRHIQRVQHQLAVTVEIQHLNVFEEWAQSANAICFLPDGSVRDPFGRLLIDMDGSDHEETAEVPYPEDAVARKARSELRVQRLGVQVLKSLPPVVGETEVDLRSPAETARRALALFATALRAESIAVGSEIPVADMSTRLPLAFKSLTPREAAFMKIEAPDEAMLDAFNWRYESLLALQWALGLAPHLPEPTKTCDVTTLARTMVETPDDELTAGAKLRFPSAILDALDLHFRLHWAIRQATLDGRRTPGGLDPGVVLERHFALNWLVRFEDAEWDDVDTPT
jgi:hypothetical protein